MTELEILKKIHDLQGEEILFLKGALQTRIEQVRHLNNLIENQDKIIELQKSILNEFVPPEKVPHLRLVKNENE